MHTASWHDTAPSARCRDNRAPAQTREHQNRKMGGSQGWFSDGFPARTEADEDGTTFQWTSKRDSASVVHGSRKGGWPYCPPRNKKGVPLAQVLGWWPTTWPGPPRLTALMPVSWLELGPGVLEWLGDRPKPSLSKDRRLHWRLWAEHRWYSLLRTM